MGNQMSVTEKKLFDVLSAEEYEILREYYDYENDVVFCRETPIRELIFREILSNETEIKRLIEKFNTKISFLDRHINTVVKLIVNDFCKTHRLYKKPLPKRLVKELVYHYIEYVSLRKVMYQYTKSYSRLKKSRYNYKLKPNQSLNKESPHTTDPKGH
jgi:DNA-binding transcriptional regulator GbsR (MarR family)